MPFYEYECSACKYYVEALQKISDPPLVKCPSCGQETLQRLVSAPVFRLKGSGWYETDFKSDKEPKRNIATDAEPASTDKKESDDSKPKVRVAKKKAVSAAAPASEAGSKAAGATPKSAKKPASKPAKTAAKQPAKKAAKKSAVKQALKKAPPKKKAVAKKVVKKAAKKSAKKAGKGKAAKKK